ncbi:MAG: hypothetical protein Q8R49_05955, partial [Rhodoferax sp.]|nr:hypothetical protein [Rhodoferax sp.]
MTKLFAMSHAAPPTPQRSPELSPSSSLFATFRQELTQHPPFAQMAVADVDYFLSQAQQYYFAPDEMLTGPDSGVVQQLFYIRPGAVSGTRGLAEQMGGAVEFDAG